MVVFPVESSDKPIIDALTGNGLWQITLYEQRLPMSIGSARAIREGEREPRQSHYRKPGIHGGWWKLAEEERKSINAEEFINDLMRYVDKRTGSVVNKTREVDVTSKQHDQVQKARTVISRIVQEAFPEK
mgnify:CR=1 FL=1